MAGDKKKKPQLSNADVVRVQSALSNRDWTLAPDLSRITGHTPRELRQIAHLANGQIIGGQKGYKLTVRASDEEKSHALASLKSRVRELNKRIAALEQYVD